jgi:hypothetical protein
MTRTSFTLVLSAALALASPVARAQENTDAARLYKEGWRLYQDKQYAEACPLLERSVAASPTIVSRGALALCYESSGKLASAYTAWQAVADQAKAAGAVEAQRGRRSAQKVEQLRPRLTMVVFQVTGSPPDTQVVLDGRTLAASEIGQPIPVDPGAHTVVARAAERVEWRSSFDLGKADEGTTRSLPVGPLEKLAPIAVERPTTPATPATTPALTAEEPRRPSGALRWVGLGAAGAGVVALGVGTVFGLSAKGKWDDAKAAGCDDEGVCPNRAAADLVDDARSKGTLSTVMIVAGVGLAAGGTLLYFLAPRERRVTAGVTPGPGGATFSIGGTF